ncbi:MAG: hypothetical protein P4N59_11925 [Negativicutes bacterium]|nr:hypothetical protein [Negativicutes bacterium]
MLKKVDWHIHSVDHTYYGTDTFSGLTEHDKRRIEYMVRWAVERELDYAAITDHDLSAPGFYAAEYAEKNFEIEIIPGIECEIFVKSPAGHEIPVHILGLGVQEQPDYVKSYSAEKLIEAIHDVGGIAAMSHPMYYPRAIFDSVKHLLDGVEVFNGMRAHVDNPDPWFNPNPQAGRFDPGNDFKGLRLYGSDRHYEHKYIAAHNQAVSEHEEEIISRILNGEYRK